MKQKRIINYAHRGASEKAPENTLAAFYLGLEMGANGIETDVQETSDHKLVLFHDNTMKRITGIDRPISDFSYNELLKLDFGIFKDIRYKNEKIVSLEDFLKYFGSKDINIAIEIKVDGIENETLSLIDTYCCRERVIITSFDFNHLETIRILDKDINLGYLTETINDETLDLLARNHIGQICPRVSKITLEQVLYAKKKGFNVRAWDVRNEELMKYALNCQVDGMTVNFPDKLEQLLR